MTSTLSTNTFATGASPTNAAPFTTTHPPTSTRTTRHSARPHHPGSDTRADILAAAMSLIADGGFSATTPRNIAELTGLASGAVAQEFGTHDDLLAATFQRLAAYELAVVSHASRTCDGGIPDRLTALVGAFTSRALLGRHTTGALLFEPVGARVNQERLTYRHQYHTLIVGIITDGVRSGELPPQNPNISARAVIGTVIEALLGWLTPHIHALRDSQDREDATALTNEVTELVLRLVGAHR